MLRLIFEKNGRARYISHLDLMRTFQRAFFRTGLPIWHTEGFNTHAFVSIVLPLSVGFESCCEILEFRLNEESDLAALPALLNATLPEGITALRCYEGVEAAKKLTYVNYEVTLAYSAGTPETAAAELAALLAQESLVMRKKSKKAKSGFTEVDLIPLMSDLQFETQEQTLIITGLFRAQNPGLNPDLMVSALREHLPHLAPDTTQFRRLAVLNEEKQPFV
jgi:radical SAM-linked protein